MKILAIETSCDETSASVVEKNDGEQTVRVLSNVTATSLAIHASTGGIIPENAAREQVKYIIPVIKEALTKARITGGGEQGTLTARSRLGPTQRRLEGGWESASTDGEANRQDPLDDIDAIAVTHGPGLIGSLLVGVETAKTLAFAFDKPIVPVHHLLAHLFANFIFNNSSNVNCQMSNVFPFIGLIVSGGHTDLLYFESLNKFKWLGGTRDDAAGEALDKIGRLLNLSYPAGPEIERRAAKFQKLNAKPYTLNAKFHSPMINSSDFDFSFSGLKAEASRFIAKENLTERLKNEICYALQDAIFKVLIKKTVRAAKLYGCSNIVLGGGVSANSSLRSEFELKIKNEKLKINVFAPEKIYTTDNAAMIGSYALLNYKPVPWKKIKAQPDLYFD